MANADGETTIMSSAGKILLFIIYLLSSRLKTSLRLLLLPKSRGSEAENHLAQYQTGQERQRQPQMILRAFHKKTSRHRSKLKQLNYSIGMLQWVSKHHPGFKGRHNKEDHKCSVEPWPDRHVRPVFRATLE